MVPVDLAIVLVLAAVGSGGLAINAVRNGYTAPPRRPKFTPPKVTGPKVDPLPADPKVDPLPADPKVDPLPADPKAGCNWAIISPALLQETVTELQPYALAREPAPWGRVNASPYRLDEYIPGRVPEYYVNAAVIETILRQGLVPREVIGGDLVAGDGICGIPDKYLDEGAPLRVLYDSMSEQSKPEEDAPPTYAKPTPGGFYQVTQADSGFLDIVGQAYGMGAGPGRLQRAQAVNDNILNRQYWGPVTNTFEALNFPSGIVYMTKSFPCHDGGDGKCFPRLFFPKY